MFRQIFFQLPDLVVPTLEDADKLHPEIGGVVVGVVSDHDTGSPVPPGDCLKYKNIGWKEVATKVFSKLTRVFDFLSFPAEIKRDDVDVPF